jgi:hypothetical protein
LNDGHDTISMLSEWLQLHGHVPIIGTLMNLRKQADHRPGNVITDMAADVIIFDVGVPYAVNWYYAQMVTIAVPDQAFVFTTSNRQALDSIVGTSTAFELTGTRDNLIELLGLVYKAAGRDEDGNVPS